MFSNCKANAELAFESRDGWQLCRAKYSRSFSSQIVGIEGGEMALSTNQLMLIEQRVTNDAPSVAVAYLLWFFLGLVSAHRFYLGRASSAILQILSYILLIGVIWWIVDAFLIPGMIREAKDAIRQRMTTDMLAYAGTADDPSAA